MTHQGQDKATVPGDLGLASGAKETGRRPPLPAPSLPFLSGFGFGSFPKGLFPSFHPLPFSRKKFRFSLKILPQLQWLCNGSGSKGQAAAPQGCSTVVDKNTSLWGVIRKWRILYLL